MALGDVFSTEGQRGRRIVRAARPPGQCRASTNRRWRERSGSRECHKSYWKTRGYATLGDARFAWLGQHGSV